MSGKHAVLGIQEVKRHIHNPDKEGQSVLKRFWDYSGELAHCKL